MSMRSIKVHVEEAAMTYYQGLARAVGVDLREIAFQGMIKELHAIETALFKRQRELVQAEQTGEFGIEIAPKEGSVDESAQGNDQGNIQADGSEGSDSSGLEDAQDTSDQEGSPDRVE
jgi:hypothetical protein